MAKTRGGSFIPVVVAFVAIGAFLAWITLQRRDEAVAVAEPDAGTTVEAGTDSQEAPTVVDPATMVTASNVRGMVGQLIELQSVPVTSALGTRLFWIELPGGSPYLVKMPDGQAVPAAGTYRIVGRIQEKNDAVIDQWMQSGALTSPDERSLAEFGTTYMEASQVRPAGG